MHDLRVFAIYLSLLLFVGERFFSPVAGFVVVYLHWLVIVVKFALGSAVLCCLFSLVGHFCEICFRFRVPDVPIVAGRLVGKHAAQRRQTQDR
jgi:hypothetical protein